MNIKKIFQNAWGGLWKLVWALLCYTIALGLALISGFFTYTFYTDGSIGLDMAAMGAMAICLELVKLIFAVGFPYLKDRDKKNEKKILFVLKISYVLSILSSLYYLLLGSDIAKSPASKTIDMLYKYIPLDFIPLRFSQFIGTISLSVIIEFLIIFLPMVAPIFKNKKNPDKTFIPADTTFSKIKEIIVLIPQMFIDKLHKKVINYVTSKNKGSSKPARINTFEKPKFKVIKSTNVVKFEKPSNNDAGRIKKNRNRIKAVITENQFRNSARNNVTGINDENIVKTSSTGNGLLEDSARIDITGDNKNLDKKELLKLMYELKDNESCPSIKQLTEHGFTKNFIHDTKKEFESLGITKTEGTKTIIACDYEKALNKLK